MEAIPGVKLPTFDRTPDQSVSQIGPWTAVCKKEVDEDGDESWEIEIRGPLAAFYLQYDDAEFHADRADAEMDALSKVSAIAAILEPLQRYL